MNVLLIVAHPDDEILGAGATISRLAREGHRIAVMTLSMSSATRENDLQEKQEISARIAGIQKRYEGHLEAMRFREADRYATVQEIENVIKEETPDWIITHYPEDLHDDHKVTAGFVQEAVRLPQRLTGYDKPIERLMYMEVSTSTDWSLGKAFEPNTYVSVDKADLEKKVAAVSVYDEVIRKVPHPRNKETIFATARYRGGQIGKKYAESFLTKLEALRW